MKRILAIAIGIVVLSVGCAQSNKPQALRKKRLNYASPSPSVIYPDLGRYQDDQGYKIEVRNDQGNYFARYCPSAQDEAIDRKTVETKIAVGVVQGSNSTTETLFILEGTGTPYHQLRWEAKDSINKFEHYGNEQNYNETVLKHVANPADSCLQAPAETSQS